MALPASEIALYRWAMRDVNTLAQADLVRRWRQFDLTDAENVRDGLLDTLPAIVAGYHVSAATVAVDWYDLMRANAGVRRRFEAIMPDPPDTSRAHALARWGVTPMFSADPNPTIALSKIAGGLQRVITDGAREAITVSSTQDPARPGWQRVGTGRCNYCRERIGLHITNSTIFESHDACGCVAVPRFD